MRLVEWNEALFGDLVRRGNPERRLYLYVDRETLADASGLDEQNAVDDFCEAFRAARGSRRFLLGADVATRWAARGFEGDPPFVADLAMTVLAVTEEPVGAPHGVYRTQNSLLGLAADAEAPTGYGEDVPAMWEIWNRWLMGPGAALGLPSARTHRIWRLQGWARSQGLVRHRDRLTIEQFVQECGAGTARIDVGDLVVWLRFRGPASADFLARIEHDEAALEVVQDVLDDETVRWRREGPRERNQRTARGLLLYDDWLHVLYGAVHIDPEMVGQLISAGRGETVTVDEHTPMVRIDVDTPPSAWLQPGVQHALTPTHSATFGGGTVFVFHDEPNLEGRLQSEHAAYHVPHHVLVHESRRREVETALRAGGSAAEPLPAFDGWFWFDDVLLPHEVPLLRALGLSAAMLPTSAAATLVGGMRLGRAVQYLCGQEPDVALPLSHGAVLVDGTTAVVSHALPPRVRLADLGLPPGEHVIEHADERLTFRSLPFVRERAETEAVLRAGRRDGASRWVFDDAREGAAEGPGLAGACAVRIAVREPLLLHRPRAEYLVLSQDGSVHQVQPLRPRWLSRHDLNADSLDVDGVASRVEGAAVVLARSPSSGAVLAVRCGDVPPAEGKIHQIPRPDLVAQLVSVSDWKWVGEPANGLARTLLGRALLWKVAQPKPKPVPPARTTGTRSGVVHGTVANPFDEVLTWLSERERSSATREDFMRAWGWVCDKLGRMDVAGDWRRALQTMADLGHVEQDFTRSRVLAAPSVATALPDANGLHALAGARPARLLERLDDPDDLDSVVADGVALTSLQIRTPVDRSGQPIGPAAVYIEMEPRHLDVVRTAYERLGVRHHGGTARWLLDSMPTLDRAVATGQIFSHAPGSEPHVYANVHGSWQWVRTLDLNRRGMYRFRQGYRSVFAWRPRPGHDLVEIEPALGRWLARRSVERAPLVHEHFADRLLVDVELPLPTLLRRAICLRSGMPPYRLRCILQNGGRAGLDMWAFENVNAAVAQQTAHILGVEVRSEYDEVKDLDA